MFHFKILSEHFSGTIQESHDKPHLLLSISGQRLYPGTSGYEAGALSTRLWRSVTLT